ncbi:TetR family transcriptional regulator [Cellulomonas sp. JZ18]|uniref:TetR/AcrR family transcriptional regulator n=1 Tax=Cellulomonas sp. JZ18 TaxID=2654191 RepID=UPI0012D45A42|nr:TetR/AcrR family transcriptional regulator [Cellulomonas sp. JZ18]QGQ17990.1 TetR family transcriptional regulator [Cellulomonas sp. JZ18]
MATRAETAAGTRRALLDAAGRLLDAGGEPAVTLRDVGAGAGVSRTAPYRHFADKDDLLAALAADAWTSAADRVRAVAEDDRLAPTDALRRALAALVDLGRTRPHLYRLMSTPPAASSPPVVAAASAAQDALLVLVARAVGDARARPVGGLLVATVHGAVDLHLAGHLPAEKWDVDLDGLVDLAVAAVART